MDVGILMRMTPPMDIEGPPRRMTEFGDWPTAKYVLLLQINRNIGNKRGRHPQFIAQKPRIVT
jgi:hypothetical protein